MRAFLESSVFFPVLMSVVFYLAGDLLRRRFRIGILNPLLISVTLTITVILLCDLEYSTYESGAKYLSYLLTPATVCFAIPLYKQLTVLRGNTVAILAGIISGSIVSMTCILVMSMAFGLTGSEYVTLLPKSITTAIGMGISEEMGGDPSVTAAAIIITGIFGNMIAELVLRLFRIKSPIAKGVAIGTASHAIGTTKAMEMGETEGAVSSLSIVVAGIVTVCGALVFGELM
ncbi:MAG: LrgB family protein [Ruminococcaceae bacterium]|nr:LrgB family protein [Oscillospiraceae bacterium]